MRVQGSGFRVQGAGFRGQGAEFSRVQGSGLRVQGSGFRVQGSSLKGGREISVEYAGAFITGRSRVMRKQTKRFDGLLPENQGQNLAITF